MEQSGIRGEAVCEMTRYVSDNGRRGSEVELKRLNFEELCKNLVIYGDVSGKRYTHRAYASAYDWLLTIFSFTHVDCQFIVLIGEFSPPPRKYGPRSGQICPHRIGNGKQAIDASIYHHPSRAFPRKS